MFTVLAAVDSLPTNAFIQYGAMGLLALSALTAAYKFWSRGEDAYKKERERGDRLESELLNVNKLISDRLAGDLVRATETMREVIEIIRTRRKW